MQLKSNKIIDHFNTVFSSLMSINFLLLCNNFFCIIIISLTHCSFKYKRNLELRRIILDRFFLLVENSCMNILKLQKSSLIIFLFSASLLHFYFIILFIFFNINIIIVVFVVISYVCANKKQAMRKINEENKQNVMQQVELFLRE